jgi:hypothetical protein
MDTLIINELAKKVVESGLATSNEMKGCTNKEMLEIESAQGVSVPTTYRSFMMHMGRNAGRFLIGSDYAYPGVLTFREEAKRLLKRSNSPFTLPCTAFVFFFHQGYTFLYFDTNQKIDNPEIFMFTEGEEPVKSAKSLSAWLFAALEDDVKHGS